jgi:hypothetical protein
MAMMWIDTLLALVVGILAGWVYNQVRWLARTSDLRAELAEKNSLAQVLREERDLYRNRTHHYTPGM